jgi:hypothetical protein
LVFRKYVLSFVYIHVWNWGRYSSTLLAHTDFFNVSSTFPLFPFAELFYAFLFWQSSFSGISHQSIFCYFFHDRGFLNVILYIISYMIWLFKMLLTFFP